jgi:hypothetical protein
MQQQPDTFLSPYVANLLTSVKQSVHNILVESSSPPITYQYLDERHLLLNFETIHALLVPRPPAFSPSEQQSADWFSAAVTSLRPLWAEIAAVEITPAVIAGWEAAQLLTWTRSCDDQQLAHAQLAHAQLLQEQLLQMSQLLQDPVGALETVLRWCPLLERRLGDLLSCDSFSSCGSCRPEPVPALLRDILAAPHLGHVLGTPAVTFLQVYH